MDQYSTHIHTPKVFPFYSYQNFLLRFFPVKCEIRLILNEKKNLLPITVSQYSCFILHSVQQPELNIFRLKKTRSLTIKYYTS